MWRDIGQQLNYVLAFHNFGNASSHSQWWDFSRGGASSTIRKNRKTLPKLTRLRRQWRLDFTVDTIDNCL